MLWKYDVALCIMLCFMIWQTVQNLIVKQCLICSCVEFIQLSQWCEGVAAQVFFSRWSSSMFSFYQFLDSILFYDEHCDSTLDFMAFFILNYMFRLSETKFWFCKCSSSSILWNIGFNMLPSDFFMSCLDSLPGYYIGEFKTLQLIVFASFGAVN